MSCWRPTPRISNEVARAFTLVGALAVIRFRTRVKDSRDAAFIFLSLAAGMGAGVGMFVETALGVTLIGALMVAVRGLRIGMHPKGETVVKLTVSARDGGPDPYPRRAFDAHLRHARLLSTRSGPDGDRSSSPTSSSRSAGRTCPPSRAT